MGTGRFGTAPSFPEVKAGEAGRGWPQGPGQRAGLWPMCSAWWLVHSALRSGGGGQAVALSLPDQGREESGHGPRRECGDLEGPRLGKDRCRR